MVSQAEGIAWAEALREEGVWPRWRDGRKARAAAGEHGTLVREH